MNTTSAEGLAKIDGESFICYLIDNCERETITEESLHGWLADFLKNPRYHRTASPEEGRASIMSDDHYDAAGDDGECDHSCGTALVCAACGECMPSHADSPATLGEDDAWKVGMFDRWNAYAQQLGYTGMCDAMSSIPELRTLAKKPEGRAVDIEAVRDAVVEVLLEQSDAEIDAPVLCDLIIDRIRQSARTTPAAEQGEGA